MSRNHTFTGDCEYSKNSNDICVCKVLYLLIIYINKIIYVVHIFCKKQLLRSLLYIKYLKTIFHFNYRK